MIWNSYFICPCNTPLKMGADLQRQVRSTVCSIKAENAQQTFALTDKARRTKRHPLIYFFIWWENRCCTLKETVSGCQFDIITFSTDRKVDFIFIFFTANGTCREDTVSQSGCFSFLYLRVVCSRHWRIFILLINHTDLDCLNLLFSWINSIQFCKVSHCKQITD